MVVNCTNWPFTTGLVWYVQTEGTSLNWFGMINKEGGQSILTLQCSDLYSILGHCRVSTCGMKLLVLLGGSLLHFYVPKFLKFRLLGCKFTTSPSSHKEENRAYM